MHVASMYFESLDHMLDVIDMDQSTFYAHLNGRADMMDLDHAVNLTKVVHLSEPRFQFDDAEDYIDVPEEDGWGSGRIKLDSDFREFLFGRRMFDPLNEELIESLTGFDRASFSNYRNEDRWIPEQGYKTLFEYFKREFNNNPTINFDIYERTGKQPIYDNLDIEQFTEYCINKEVDGVNRNEPLLPGNPTEQRLALEEACLAREKFDTLLGDYLDKWEQEGTAFDVRNEIVYSVIGDRILEPTSAEEREKIEELVPYGIVRPTSKDTYWVKI